MEKFAYIYYLGDDKFYHTNSEDSNLNLVSNHQYHLSAGDAYMLTEEEKQFKLSNPSASISEVWNLKLSDETLESLRSFAYKRESDSLFIAWQKYLAQEKLEKAAVAKQAWLDKVNEIDARYPYSYELSDESAD